MELIDITERREGDRVRRVPRGRDGARDRRARRRVVVAQAHRRPHRGGEEARRVGLVWIKFDAQRGSSIKKFLDDAGVRFAARRAAARTKTTSR